MDDLTIREGEIAGFTLINEHLIKDDITQQLSVVATNGEAHYIFLPMVSFTQILLTKKLINLGDEEKVEMQEAAKKIKKMVPYH